MTEEQLAAIRARLAAATPGPWYVEWDSDGDDYRTWTWPCNIRATADHALVVSHGDGFLESMQPVENAKFIAHAPEDIKALLDALERTSRIRAITLREMLAYGLGWRMDWNDFDGRQLRAQLDALAEWAGRAQQSEAELDNTQGTESMEEQGR